MSLEARPLQLPSFVDERRVSRFQYGVITLCGLVMFIDGFDTQAISYMAPHIAKEWGLSPQTLAPIFSSALVGLMVGYLALSPLSDRFGHKRVIVVSTIAFALCTLVAVWAFSVPELIVLRFLTGLGLGAAAPSCVAMTGEFSPKRLRATFVLVIYCGFSLGFVVAGLVAGWLIPAHGWRSMFVVGALAPLLLVPLLLRFLPESPVFMIRRNQDPQRIHRVFRRMDRTLPEHAAPTFAVEAADAGKRAALSSLFTRDRVLGTVLLWFVFAINLAEFYALQSWLPTIMTSLDYSMSTVVTATTLTTVGGIAAAFITGPCMDRLGAYGTLGALYLVGFVFVALTGLAFSAPLWVLLTANFLAGCCISGGQKSLIALAAVFYPAPIRSTGVGWALGIGRVGGILGPIVIGAALAAQWSAGAVFYAMAVPMLVAGVAVLVLGRLYGTRRNRVTSGVRAEDSVPETVPGEGAQA
ncbi:MAG: tpaK [Pseudonocardia sp.]|jgi:AAHS family 4-hydroxybenzoate transporter-like MFS transporter|uniref:MFS transporter n=1 Tax=Pseudonocardia sp. TaxID=60912 RepID=UPI0026239098|nr:MFS transporter [Pseudonocardia sp.]MCU1628902.1 tpaK [Pseudonocardia sp.]MDT7702465.1 transporter, family, 4-hydroxybenzoate transporter [Pseudonocardiales bacterium]